MLTRRDETIEDADEVLDIAASIGVRHIGFKDVGASREAVHRLTSAIRRAVASPAWRS